jgi:hypothetical protein
MIEFYKLCVLSFCLCTLFYVTALQYYSPREEGEDTNYSPREEGEDTKREETSGNQLQAPVQRNIGEPVHCVQETGKWSMCVPVNGGVCGNGTQTRTTRIIQQPNSYGNECRSEFEERSCFIPCHTTTTNESDVDCVATVGEFGKCSATCGPGVKTRQVNIIRQARGFGIACPAGVINCNEHECTEDDIFELRGAYGGGADRTTGPFGPSEQRDHSVLSSDCVPGITEWSPCSEQVCGTGRQYATRIVKLPAKGVGKECEGIGERTSRSCYAHESGQEREWMCERTPILVGKDIGVMTSTQEVSCAEACNAKVPCIGFSYSNGTCTLKSETSDWTEGQMFYTRRGASGEPISVDASQVCTETPGYDCIQTPVYSGNDDTNYAGKTVQECKRQCLARASCIGFSRESDGRCWLKTNKVDVSKNKRFYRKNR